MNIFNTHMSQSQQINNPINIQQQHLSSPVQRIINSQQKTLHIHTLQQQLSLLKRACLKIEHIPQIKLIGERLKDIQLTLKVYDKKYLTFFKMFDHKKKIVCLLDLVRTYRQLVKEYGLFLLTENHIKFNQEGYLAVWINQDFYQNWPSQSLSSNPFNQHRAVSRLIDIVRKEFSQRFFKYSKINTLEQLQQFFTLVKKRNDIHKKCQQKAREKSKFKGRQSLNIKTSAPTHTPSKRFDLLQRPSSFFSTFMHISNINNRLYGSNTIFHDSNKASNSIDSRAKISKGSNESKQMKSQLQTTNISSDFRKQRRSYQQIASTTRINSMQKKKSCVIKPAQDQNMVKLQIKRSQVTNGQRKNVRLNTNFCPIIYKNKEKYQKQTEKPKQISKSARNCTTILQIKKCFAQKKNSLQQCLNNLFLSEIIEDPQNEIRGSGLGRSKNLKQFFQDFQNVFY